MKQFILKIITNQRLMKYFVMAVVIVVLELMAFQVIYLLTKNYYIATVLSFIIGVLLNWIGSRLLVFGRSSHHPLKEFIMVLIGSLVGVGIQLLVVHLSVTLLGLYPLLGKCLSIVFSFFWNYFFRSRVVYK